MLHKPSYPETKPMIPLFSCDHPRGGRSRSVSGQWSVLVCVDRKSSTKPSSAMWWRPGGKPMSGCHTLPPVNTWNRSTFRGVLGWTIFLSKDPWSDSVRRVGG